MRSISFLIQHGRNQKGLPPVALSKFSAIKNTKIIVKVLNRIFYAALCIAVILFLKKPALAGETLVELQKKVDEIGKEIAEIRGLQFKHQVHVRRQSQKDFGKYLDRMIEKQMNDKKLKYYGKVVKKLGLYRGPEIKDFNTLVKKIMQNQAAAYYDPDSETFYVVMQDLPEAMLGGVFAHELYHGLQDQYYDLNEYLLAARAQGKLNDDELLARQAVVEGEATYIMTLWSMKNLFGSIPDPSILEMAINLQTHLDAGMVSQMMQLGLTPQFETGDLKKSLQAMDQTPAFLIDTLLGAYLKGMGFVFEIQKQGWEKVRNLYSNPPVSTEQILHPEKWLKGERPYNFEWPSFEKEELFTDWDLLENNTIGEMQWRIIFNEHDLGRVGRAASTGWNGDTYAVFKKKSNDDDLLLLLFTSWDSIAEAEEFISAYQELLKTKYPEENQEGTINVKIEITGNNILIVEGGKEESMDAFLEFMNKIKILPK